MAPGGRHMLTSHPVVAHKIAAPPALGRQSGV